MHDHFKAELWRLIIVLMAASVIGSLTNTLVFSLLFAPGILLLWHLYQMFVIEVWLHTSEQAYLEQLKGIWAYAAESIERTRKRQDKGKARLSRIVQLFHQTFEALPDAAVVLDNQRRVEWSNLAANKQFGLVKRDNSKIEDLINREEFTDYLRQGDFSEPLLFVVENPIPCEMEVSLTSFGQQRMLLTAHDVTESRQLQAVRRDFIANVSHELRTPLTVVSGYLEMLLDDSLDDVSQQALLACTRQSERMQSIVRDLLMLSKLEMDGGLPVTEAQAVIVSQLLKQLIEDAKGLSGDKEHQISLNVNENISLLGTEAELSGAFGNLIFNAVIHTPPKTRITVFWGDDDRGAKLVVADKGPGIESKHLNRLTERFYRVDKGRSRDSGGTGLGLSIVKHVIKRHEGGIEIESTAGMGSRFICRFPEHRVRRKVD